MRKRYGGKERRRSAHTGRLPRKVLEFILNSTKPPGSIELDILLHSSCSLKAPEGWSLGT